MVLRRCAMTTLVRPAMTVFNASWISAGFVANFASEVVKEQLPLPAGGLGGQRVEQFGRGEALVSLLNHQLSFPDHVHEFDTDESGLRRVKRFES